jgi:hypothetical protein
MPSPRRGKIRCAPVARVFHHDDDGEQDAGRWYAVFEERQGLFSSRARSPVGSGDVRNRTRLRVIAIGHCHDDNQATAVTRSNGRKATRRAHAGPAGRRPRPRGRFESWARSGGCPSGITSTPSHHRASALPRVTHTSCAPRSTHSAGSQPPPSTARPRSSDPIRSSLALRADPERRSVVAARAHTGQAPRSSSRGHVHT